MDQGMTEEEYEAYINSLVTDEEFHAFVTEAYQRHLNPIDRFSVKRIERESLSMVHWQRDSIAVVHLDCVKGCDRPYKCSVLLLNSNLELYRGIYPFEAYLRFEEGERAPGVQQAYYEKGMSRKTFIRMFDKWKVKAQLGYTPAGVPTKILPIFGNERQLFLARDIWTPAIFDDIFEKPYRILTNFAAYENDKAAMQYKSKIRFGKHTYTQIAARLGNKIDSSCDGLVRATAIAKLYKTLTEKSLV